MLQTEEQNKRAKENIRSAWAEGDLLGLISAGIDSFLNLLGNSAPLPFQQFLEYTSISFDKYILETSEQEHLDFIGGKMFLNVGEKQNASPVTIQLSADFYFQTQDKHWVIKKKNGKIDSTRFTDWDTDTRVTQLKKAGKLEFPIDPPDTKEK